MDVSCKEEISAESPQSIYTTAIHRIAMKKRTLTLNGYEMVEKTVRPSGNTGHVIVPKKWLNKKVVVVRVGR